MLLTAESWFSVLLRVHHCSLEGDTSKLSPDTAFLYNISDVSFLAGLLLAGFSYQGSCFNAYASEEGLLDGFPTLLHHRLQSSTAGRRLIAALNSDRDNPFSSGDFFDAANKTFTEYEARLSRYLAK